MLQQAELAPNALIATAPKSKVAWLTDHASTGLGCPSSINHAVTLWRSYTGCSVDVVPWRAWCAAGWAAIITICTTTLADSPVDIESRPTWWTRCCICTLEAVELAPSGTALFGSGVQVESIITSLTVDRILTNITVVLTRSSWAFRLTSFSDEITASWALIARRFLAAF